MKKRTLRLLLLLVALLVIIGAYALVSSINKAKEQPQADTQGQEVLEKDIVLTLAKDTDITELNWKTSGSEITLKAIPQAPSATSKPDAVTSPAYTWVYAADETLSIDQNFPQQATQALREIAVTQTLLKPGKLSEYGLSTPSCIVNVVCADGTKKSLRIGAQNAVTMDYYAQLAGTDMVYLINPAVVNVFQNSLLDIIVYEAIPKVDTSKLVIASGENNLEILNLKNAGIMYSDAFTWYLRGAGDNLQALDNDKIQALLLSLEELEWVSCEDASANSAELSGYGLDQSALNIEAYEIGGYSTSGERIYNSVLSLLLGDYTQDGAYRYARLKDSNMVYLINSDAVAGFQSAAYDTLRERSVCLLDWKTVDQMEVTIDGKSAILAFERTQTPGGTTQENFTVNGEKIIKSTLYRFLDTISELKWVDERPADAVKTDEQVKIRFLRNTEQYSEITLEFMPYSNNFYLYTFNGESGRLVEASDVARLKEAFAAHIL